MCWFSWVSFSALVFFLGFGNFGLETCFERKRWFLFLFPSPPFLLIVLPVSIFQLLGPWGPNLDPTSQWQLKWLLFCYDIGWWLVPLQSSGRWAQPLARKFLSPCLPSSRSSFHKREQSTPRSKISNSEPGPYPPFCEQSLGANLIHWLSFCPWIPKHHQFFLLSFQSFRLFFFLGLPFYSLLNLGFIPFLFFTIILEGSPRVNKLCVVTSSVSTGNL